MKPDMERIAWNGLEFETPPGWWPGVVKGRYLRLDDEEGPVLECKWAYGPSGALDRRLSKSPRKKGKGLGAADAPAQWKYPLGRLKKQGFAAKPFTWGKDEQGKGGGVHLRHKEKKAALVLNVFRLRDKGIVAGVAAAMAGLTLAGQGDGLAWNIFGMRAETPEGFMLIDQQFNPGHFRLTLEKPGDKDGLPGFLVLDRTGPARVLLRRTSLAEWAGSYYAKLPLFKQARSIGESGERVDLRLDRKSTWFRRKLVKNYRRHTACRFRVWLDQGSGFLAAVHAAGVRPVKEEWFERICHTVSFVPQSTEG